MFYFFCYYYYCGIYKQFLGENCFKVILHHFFIQCAGLGYLNSVIQWLISNKGLRKSTWNAVKLFNRPPEVSKNESEPLIWWENHLYRLAVHLYRDLRAKWDHRLFNNDSFSLWCILSVKSETTTRFTDGKSCDSDCNSLIKVSVHDTGSIINCALDDLLCIHEDPFEQQALMLDLSRAPAKQDNCYFPFYHSQMNAQQVYCTHLSSVLR